MRSVAPGVLVVLAIGLAPSPLGAQGQPLAGPPLPAFAFVSRTVAASRPNVDEREAAVELATGRLLVREGESVTVIVDGTAVGATGETPVDVMDPAVSFDGERIVFSGYSRSEHAWRIFEVHRSGAGLRQLTRSDQELDLARYGDLAAGFTQYDDVDPCYLPDGSICFVSTRYPGFATEGRLRATNLYVVAADGGAPRRVTTERFGADTPAVDPTTGRIVYSRWWRTVQAPAPVEVETEPGAPPAPPPPPPAPVPPGSPGYGGGETPPPLPPDADVDDVEDLLDAEAKHVVASLPLRGVPESEFPGVNSWFLASIRPDGTGLVMHSGFRLDRQITQAYRPSFFRDGVALALFIPQTPLLGVPGANGLRSYAQGAVRPVELGGPQTFQQREAPVVYASAEALPDGRILVSAALTGHGQRNYGIFVQGKDDDAKPELVYDVPSRAELDAVPLVAREVPTILPADRTLPPLPSLAPRTAEEAYRNGSFKFAAQNIHFQGDVDLAIAGAPPVGRGLAIEFYMAPQRTSTFPADPPVLLATREIPADGKVEIDLPAGVPLFEVIRRIDGEIAQGRDGQIFHVGGLNFGEAGTTARCVGCHAGHTLLEVPEDAAYTNIAPSARVSASSVRTDLRAPFLGPDALVDRRTDRLVGDWAAATKEMNTFVRLEWPVPISAREVVVYAPKRGAGFFGTTNLLIRAFRVQSFKSWFLVEDKLIESPILPGGTPVSLDPANEIDAIAITIEGRFVSGSYEGSSAPALAEVEVIAKALASLPPVVQFTRGDTNCDDFVNITDAVSLLGALFEGHRGSCCKEANDINRDREINITDPIYLLNFLFLGGEGIPKPSPTCGRAEMAGFGCDHNTCGK